MNDKIDYQRQLDTILKDITLENTPALILHSCCGPCSSYVLDYLKDYFRITVLYYNPNIYPFEEYEHRLAEQRRLIDEMNDSSGCDIRLIDLPYDHGEFLSYVSGLENEPEGGARCARCFRFRLEKTFELAVSNSADYYATTLTVSPHKNAVMINQIGESIQFADSSLRHALWLPSDFKKKDGYKKSIELSKKHDLYRQNYCGCEFSMWFNK